MIEQYQIYENRQEAESFLRKNEVGLTHSDYSEIKKLSVGTPALLGILTKIVFGKKVELSKVKEILGRFEILKNDLKRDKISPQTFLIKAFKEDNTIEFIEDQLDASELKKQTLSFINDLQHAKVRNELKTAKFYSKIENGIISLKSTKNWETQLKFISEKSARFKTAREIIPVFETMIRNALGGFSPEGIVGKIESTPGAIVVYNSGGFVVAQVFTRTASCTLGSSSWCISGGGGSYFDQYADPKQGKQQYFVWDTSKTPTDLYSLMGVTLHDNGRLHTAHLKNDRGFQSGTYFSGLVRSGAAPKELLVLLNTQRDSTEKKMNARVQLNYAIFGGKTVTITQFKTLFKTEWNNSKKENIQDFKNLFDLYFTVVGVNKITNAEIEKTRNKVTYLRIQNDLKKLMSDLDIEDCLIYFMAMEEKNHTTGIPESFLLHLMNDDRFGDVDQMIKAQSYMHMTTYSTQIKNYPDKIPLDITFNSIGFEEGLSQHTMLDEFVDKYDVNDFSFDITMKDHFSVFNICMKHTTNQGSRKPEKIIQFLFDNISELNCDTLHINGFYPKAIDMKYFNQINISEKLVFSNVQNCINIDNILRKVRVDNLTFLNSKLENFKVTTNVPLLENISLIRSSLEIDGNVFLPTKKLTLEYAGVLSEDISKFDLVFLEELRATTDVLYNLSDEIRKELKEENVKLTSIGGLNLPIKESMNSRLLSALYGEFKDKSKIQTFIKLLNKNNIDVHNISDDQIEYTSAVNLKRVVDKLTGTNRAAAFIVVCVKANEGVRYVINYQKTTPQSTYGGYGSRGKTPVWNVKFLNDLLAPVTARAKKNTEISGELYKGEKSLPTLSKVIEETDYIFVINKKEIKKLLTKDVVTKRTGQRKGASVYKKDNQYKKELINRLDDYIRTKYVFKVGDDEYDINYINRVSSRLSSLYNIIYHQIDIKNLFDKVTEFVNDKKAPEEPVKKGKSLLSPVGLPTKKVYTVSSDGVATKGVPKSDAYVHYIQQSIDKLIPYSKNSNTIINMNNYRVKIGDKHIYPNVSHLKTLKDNLEKIESTIKKHFSNNPVDIEFISDLDLFVKKYEYISSFIQKLLIGETSLPVILHSLGEKNNLNNQIQAFRARSANAVYPFGYVSSPLNIYAQNNRVDSRDIDVKRLQSIYTNFSEVRAELNKTRPNQRILKTKLNELIQQHIVESEMVLKKLNLFFKL